jgi:cell division septal protein FtsQ
MKDKMIHDIETDARYLFNWIVARLFVIGTALAIVSLLILWVTLWK